MKEGYREVLIIKIEVVKVASLIVIKNEIENLLVIVLDDLLVVERKVYYENFRMDKQNFVLVLN